MKNDSPHIPALEGDEESIAERVKLNSRKRKIQETGLKILTPNKLLTRLIILLPQIKAGNNWWKLKNEIRKYNIFCISIIKLPKLSEEFIIIHYESGRKSDYDERSHNLFL